MTTSHWTIANTVSSVSVVVEGSLGPAFVIKVMETEGGITKEVTYATILVRKLDGNPLVAPRKFYENQLAGMRSQGDPGNGIVYAINTANEKTQPGEVNVVMIDRN